MGTHGGELDRSFLGARKAAHRAASHRTAADAGIRRPDSWAHGIPHSGSRRESRHPRATSHSPISSDGGSDVGAGSGGISPSHEPAVGAAKEMARGRSFESGRAGEYGYSSREEFAAG